MFVLNVHINRNYPHSVSLIHALKATEFIDRSWNNFLVTPKNWLKAETVANEIMNIYGAIALTGIVTNK